MPDLTLAASSENPTETSRRIIPSFSHGPGAALARSPPALTGITVKALAGKVLRAFDNALILLALDIQQRPLCPDNPFIR